MLHRHARLLSHVVFWLAALAFYTVYFGQRQDAYGQSLIFVSLLLPITIATTYFLLYHLIPRYLLTRRYGYFALYFCYTLVLSLYLELLLVVVLYVTVAEYQALVVAAGLVDLLDGIVGMYLVVFLATALHLLKRWYSMQAVNTQLERARLEAEVKLKEAQLKLLKSQIHPHFLFNTLNNLYGLTLEQSDRAPDVVLRISDMLDYMLYRSDAPRVPLTGEVEHLRNYLALEQLRYADRVQITFETEGTLDAAAIAPLLLIPFVENSFKHGVSQSSGTSWVHLHLTLRDGVLVFIVENSKGREPAADPRSVSEGIGLDNVKQRLNLLYPDRHTLVITEQEHDFKVVLTLHLEPGSTL